MLLDGGAKVDLATNNATGPHLWQVGTPEAWVQALQVHGPTAWVQALWVTGFRFFGYRYLPTVYSLVLAPRPATPVPSSPPHPHTPAYRYTAAAAGVPPHPAASPATAEGAG